MVQFKRKSSITRLSDNHCLLADGTEIDIMKFKIVADSSVDLKELIYPVAFELVPLKIMTDSEEFVDDESLDAVDMATRLKRYKGKSRSSCPNPDDYLAAFGDAENVFCVTITSGLSGSCNAAMTAARLYEEEHAGRRVCVIDSLSTGPECALIAERIAALIEAGKDFEGVKGEIENYKRTTGLVFSLESLHNLAANGRVNPLVAKLSGMLGIRVVGKASDEGTLEVVEKARGREAALSALIGLMEREGYSGGRVRIHHAANPTVADEAARRLLEKYPSAKITVDKTGGLCSFYAELGGVLVGFEKG